MSDYERNKQVLYPVTKELLEKLNYNDAYDLEDRVVISVDLDF